MKTKDKAALLAAFDLSPGSAYDRPGALRSLAESHPDALAVVAGINACSPLPMLRATIVSLPVDDAGAVTAENAAAVTTKPKAKRKRKPKAKA